MELREIELGRLDSHPHNSNVMATDRFEKLIEHIRHSGRYPPLIVRPVGGGRYQILDGHHRAAALRRLGHGHARCVAWEVDDEQALVLLGTLNRLEGADDPVRRAELVRALGRRRGPRELANLLPDQADRLRTLMELRPTPPAPRPPREPGEMVQAVYFFLKPDQRRRLEKRLRADGGEREAALMRLVERTERAEPSP